MTAVTRFAAIICSRCGEGLVSCPRCHDRGEFALLCVSPTCSAIPTRHKRRLDTATERNARLAAKKRALCQCYKCPLGSTAPIVAAGLCQLHHDRQRERQARAEQRRKAVA